VPLSLKLRRYAYRLAYVGFRVWSFTLRPRIRGVKCVLTNDGSVVLVRHTYGRRRWDLPGGTAKRGEPPRETARREMAEELGVTLDGLTDLGRFTGRIDGRRDTMHCFHAEIPDRELTLDLAEIDEARWFSPDRLPSDVARNVRVMVALVDGRPTPTRSSRAAYS
jgi:8-oxo-dGTP pyrophosphatase MutT (NUDIX family)